jgi:hypothetical protein
MLEKLSIELKKRFYIITFLVLPVVFICSFFLSIKIAIALKYYIDTQLIIIMIIGFILLYLRSIVVIYRKLLKLNSKEPGSDL